MIASVTSRARRAALYTATSIAAGAALFAGWVTHDLQKTYSSPTETATGRALATKIKRGRYVATASDCVACHSTEGSPALSGGYKIDTPFGPIYSSNITQDRETGIGSWSKADFDRAVRHGKGRHGYLYPAMPYTAYTKLTDRDLDDMWAYMKTIAPARKKVVENRLPFPFNQRWLLAGWNMLFFKDGVFHAAPAMRSDLARGQYLVDGFTHCGACHTARNLMGAEGSQYLQGGTIGGWHAPDLTANPNQGIGAWSDAQVVQYLKSGTNDFSVASGEMGVAVNHSLQYLNDADLKAITRYLKSIPASPARSSGPLAADDASMQTGKRIFETQCNSCHLTSGAGVRRMIPKLTNSAVVNADDPTSLIHMVLRGADGPVSHANPTAAGMPAFDWRLSDQQVANVLTYLRKDFGNSASHVNPSDVASLRKSLKARQTLVNPQMSR